MIWALLLALPMGASFLLPRVLLRLSPGARRAELAIGAPVISLLIGFGWFAIIWGLVILGPMIFGSTMNIFGVSNALGAGFIGLVSAPVCALIGALWVTRQGQHEG